MSWPGVGYRRAASNLPRSKTLRRTWPRYPARLPAHLSMRGATAIRPPVTGEVLISYLTRLAHANYLTLTEVLAVLPSWFSTKIGNRDDRAQHHMLIPAAAEALRALAHLTGTPPASLARALPAFGAADPHSPVRATTACHRCAARHGIHQPVPVHLPAHHKVCTRHGIWLSDAASPTSTSPPARRSSPPSTGPAVSCAATRPRN